MDSEHLSRAARHGAAQDPLSVFLVDDHALYRQCLKALLAADAGLHIVGEAGDAAEALAAAGRCAPAPLADVVLLDVAMPETINSPSCTTKIMPMAQRNTARR